LSHVLAQEKEAASNQRFVIAVEPFTFQDFIDVTAKLYPDVVKDKGTPGAGKSTQHPVLFKNDKGINVLGLKYRSKEETVKDSIEDFKRRGWIQ
jgi:hypothetical protein